MRSIQSYHTTRSVKYEEAVLAAKHIYEEILAVNRMMMTETIPFYRFKFVKELKKLSADYLKQNKIVEQSKPSLNKPSFNKPSYDEKIINEISTLQASLFKSKISERMQIRKQIKDLMDKLDKYNLKGIKRSNREPVGPIPKLSKLFIDNPHNIRIHAFPNQLKNIYHFQ